MPERRVAGFHANIGSDTVANVTSFERADEISEEEVASLNDTVGDPPIINEKYLPVARGTTASMSGIVHSDDDALSAIRTAARTGAIITLEFRYEDESGYDLEGFFTNFTDTGDKGEATVKYSGSFRVNDQTDVPAPA